MVALVDGILESLRIAVGFLAVVYRRGLGAPGQYRDPVCGMRVDDDGPSATHDGDTYHFCSRTCKRSFEDEPGEYAHHDPEFGGGHDHDH